MGKLKNEFCFKVGEHQDVIEGVSHREKLCITITDNASSAQAVFNDAAARKLRDELNAWLGETALGTPVAPPPKYGPHYNDEDKGTCPVCHGSGIDYDDGCAACGGTGDDSIVRACDDPPPVWSVDPPTDPKIIEFARVNRFYKQAFKTDAHKATSREFPQYICNNDGGSCAFNVAGIGMQCEECNKYVHPGDYGFDDLKRFYLSIADEPARPVMSLRSYDMAALKGIENFDAVAEVVPVSSYDLTAPGPIYPDATGNGPDLVEVDTLLYRYDFTYTLSNGNRARVSVLAATFERAFDLADVPVDQTFTCSRVPHEV